MNGIAYGTLAIAALIGLQGCQSPDKRTGIDNDSIMIKLNDFARVSLTADLGSLNENERQMIPLLIQVADIMDGIFWQEAYGNKDALLASIADDGLRQLVMINYGPWERLNDDRPFIDGTGAKPAGANFYPADMSREEFEQLEDSGKTSLYTLIRRDSAGKLTVVPYHEAFGTEVRKASELLLQAAELAEGGLRTYLRQRAEAFLSDDYYSSDMAWMTMKDNRIDFITGPIETYEDKLYGYKAAHESFVLIKDMEWSRRLERFVGLLPALQESLPVATPYRKEKPGNSSDLAVYDVIYYAGDCNAGSKTIAINLPNDEKVQAQLGSRRLQLKNAMQAKFDRILVPIAGEVISEEQLANINFDAFFTNTMFHEIAHGLGVSITINGRGTVREALKEHYTILEEGKADIVGLYLESRLQEMGELDIDMTDEYATFLAGIFRSIRFGTSSAHGMANLIRFNYFKEKGAFSLDSEGKYIIDEAKMKEAMISLSSLILTLQGDGDYDGAAAFIRQYGFMDPDLAGALQRIETRDIPVDIVFDQGPEVLGL